MSGTLSLFGFPSTDAEVGVLSRTSSWRRLRAGGYFTAGLVLAPVVGMVPPHAPWALGALGMGGFLGMRKLRERFTVVSFRGECPKCGGDLPLTPGIPLRVEMSVPCEGCHHDSRLSVVLPPEERSA